MKGGGFGYLVKQGLRNMGQNRLMTFAGMGVLIACLIITGVATLLSLNVTSIINYLEGQNEIVAYLHADATPEQVTEMGAQLQQLGNVATVRYITREEAFEQMKGYLGEYGGLLESYRERNIFPSSYRVTVEDLALVEATHAQIKAMGPVESTASPTEVAGIMVTLRRAVNTTGWGLIVLLGLVSVVVISNTIRLTVFARRKEINIMKFVGATNAFIRLPFFVEGMGVGALAGVIAAGAVCGGYHLAYNALITSRILWAQRILQSLYPLADVWAPVLCGFVLAGVLLGGIGTAFSVRRHLRV